MPGNCTCEGGPYKDGSEFHTSNCARRYLTGDIPLSRLRVLVDVTGGMRPGGRTTKDYRFVIDQKEESRFLVELADLVARYTLV